MKFSILYASLFSVFSVISVALVLPFVNLIFMGIAIPGSESLPVAKSTALWVLCVVIWMAFLMKNLFFVLARRASNRMKSNTTGLLREHYLSNLLSMDYQYFRHAEQSALLSRVVSTTARIADIKATQVHDLARTVPLIAGYATILIWLNWPLVVLIAVLVPILGWLQNRASRHAGRLVTDENFAHQRLLHRVQQMIQNIKLVKLMDLERRESEGIRSAGRIWERGVLRRAGAESMFLAGLEMLGVSMGVLLLFFIGHQTIEGNFRYGPGGFVLFVASVFSMIDPCRELFRTLRSRRETDALALMLNLSPVATANASEHLEKFTGSIRFDDVSYAFENGPSIIAGFSCSIRAGDHIGLMGASGAGKSTWGDLLVGLLVPTHGQVLLDEIPVHRLSAASRASIFGVISQEPYVFHDTIRNNMCCGVFVPDSRLNSALSDVGLTDWLEAQPRGLDTLIGDRGMTMSGGERQRLTIARLLLRNPDVILLDEATASLDSATEERILSLVFEIFQGKTIIAISHRPVLYRYVDQVMSLDKSDTDRLKFRQDLTNVPLKASRVNEPNS